MIEIPLTNKPEQLFNITIAGITYDVRIVWNTRSQQWSISFSTDGEDIITGIALAGGVDITKQYTLDFNNMFAINLVNPELDPTFAGLGTDSKLFILTDEEITS